MNIVRVIYRWHVEKENFPEFKRLWQSATYKVSEKDIGSYGSFLLRSNCDEREVIIIEKWKSISAWKRFEGKLELKETIKASALGDCISVEAYEEIEDHTKRRKIEIFDLLSS